MSKELSLFTGIVDSKGRYTNIVRGSRSLILGITPDKSPYETRPGDSIAVNGVCLTVESISGNELFCTAVYETLRKTTLANAAVGQRLNLERALRPADRMGGHFVSGHVDGVGKIVYDRRVGESIIRKIQIPEGLRRYTADKGSIAIEGVSLTITESADDNIEVSLVPYTLNETTMKDIVAGDFVNIECDILVRYVARLMGLEEKGEDSADNTNLLDKMESLGF